MKTIFTILEKVVIESLFHQERSFRELQDDTQLPTRALLNSINALYEKNYIIEQNDKYILNLNKILKENVSTSIKNKCSDINELIRGAIDNHLTKTDKSLKQSGLHLKKIWLDKKEEKILNALLQNIETFVFDLENKTNKNSTMKLANKKVIFWGHSIYSDIIEKIITL